MGNRASALMTAAGEAAKGMGNVADGKPDEAPLQSDARTFRGLADMLTGLSAELRQSNKTVKHLRRILERIAMLEVRGATELIERGDWKGMVDELQTMAHDVLNGGERRSGPR